MVGQIIESGSVSEDEAMTLATYLNEHRGARNSWPGNLLYAFLQNVYEDGSMRNYELEALAKILEAVVLQRDGMVEEARQSEIPPVSPEEVDGTVLLLPDLSALDDGGAKQVPGMPNLFFSATECDCLDWQTVRRKLPPNSPGRLCRHLAKVLSHHLEALPPSTGCLKNLIQWAAMANRALAPVADWHIVIDGDRPVIAAVGTNQVCHLYCANDSGKLELYSYNLKDNTWSANNRPPQFRDSALKEFIACLSTP